MEDGAMVVALFSVPLADLDYGDRDLEEEIPVEWLAASFSGTEATPRGPGRLDVTLSKTGREVMVRGHARAGVTMPCSRTLDPVQYDLRADVFLLLEPRTAGPAHSAKAAGKPSRPEKKRSGKAGPGAAASRREREKDAELEESDAARDTYEGDRLVLDPFVREFLLLELPMVPLREDLRSDETPAIERPPEPSGQSSTREGIDPRLAPLAAIASRLRDKKE
jgi:uncharacterized protein